ncbi:MAG: hypothetical protein WCI77_07010 [Candidatus Omnitrophota bacterium]
MQEYFWGIPATSVIVIIKQSDNRFRCCLPQSGEVSLARLTAKPWASRRSRGSSAEKLKLFMSDDPIDEFLGYDFAMGADSIKCPHRGHAISRSLFFDNDAEAIECPKCGGKVENNE